MRKAIRSRRTSRDTSSEADELILFTDNTSELHRQKDAFLSNIHKKMKRGTYDSTLGVKLWMYYVERAAKMYAKENLASEREWSSVFPPAVRKEVAQHYEKEERGLIERGEYDKYPPVRASAAPPKRRAGVKRSAATRDTSKARQARRHGAAPPKKHRPTARYFTVVIPRLPKGDRRENEWNGRLPPGWASQSRGSFTTREAAHAWAKTHLNGAPYRLGERESGSYRGKNRTTSKSKRR